MKRILYILLLFIPVLALASHNRGGEITYLHLGGYTYEFTITTCTDVGPDSQADRNELYIDYGDGIIDTLFRDQISPQPFNHQKNTYIGVHTFSSAGTYVICMQDPNRNNNILNINGGNSDTEVFSVQSQLVISPFLGNGNNSVQFDECPCPAIACVGNIYCYNPQAVDPDNDILTYELTSPFGADCLPMGIQATYLFPNDVGGGSMSIDESTGTVCWDSPGMVGEFNFTIKITEWRNGVKVGYVYRDVQLTVDGNCTNTPPTITSPPEICVIAGDNINFNVTANDFDGNTLSLSASGNPFSASPNAATFPNVSAANSVTSNFNWNTACSDIKPGTYQVLFAVQDNGDPVFSNYSETTIKIIPPKVTGIQANPFGNGVNIQWNPSSCNEAEGYNIYRINSPASVITNCCNDSTPTMAGYNKIGTVYGNSISTFYDNTSLTLGIEYCYVVTAFFNIEQVESCPSDTACARLKKEVPILTHVTVNTTDASIGIDSVMWSKPTELDTNQFPGPYHYKVYQGSGLNNINTFVGQTAYQAQLFSTDTTLIVNLLNTLDMPHYYRTELYYTNNGNDSLIGSSNSGGSIFVSTVVNDNEIELKWSEQVPWINTDYEVFRADQFGGPYSFIGTTQLQSYTDTGLVNGANYCYYIKSIGYYSNPSIINPIENYSQIVCDTPVDKTAPCAPTLTINSDCDFTENEITWNNPNNSCADDVVGYNLYFTPVEGEEMELIASFTSASDTSYFHSNGESLAGCYVITALDSVQYNNESDSSNVVCFDNCPLYTLPNVFSPNADGSNDVYHAIFPYKYVESIEMDIYNRWGQIVFSTTNPDVNWDGKHKDSNVPVPDGVYYYLCTVNTIRLTGIEPIVLKGFIHVFDNTGTEAK